MAVGGPSPHSTGPILDSPLVAEAENSGSYFHTLSVCIPALNESQNISRLLEFLREESFHRASLIQVIVDASGSSDSTQQVVETMARTWPALEVLPPGPRLGLSSTLDRLIHRASGDLVVRMDADVVPEPGALDLMVRQFDDFRVGIAGPRIVPCRTTSHMCDSLATVLYQLHHVTSLHAPKTTVVQVFRQIGVSLGDHISSEDTLLQSLVQRSGFEVRYEPAALVRIQPPGTPLEYLRQRIRTIMASRCLWRESGLRSSTQDPRVALPTVAMGLRRGLVASRELLVFIAFELFAQLSVRVLTPFTKRNSVSTFSQIATTKSPSWTTELIGTRGAGPIEGRGPALSGTGVLTVMPPDDQSTGA